MKNVKLSLFVLALTLAVVIPSGVYACEKGEKVQSKNSVTQKIASRDAKTKQWNEKFIKNHANNKELSDKKIASRDEKNQEWAKKYTKNHDEKVKYEDAKIKLSAEEKAVIEAKKAEMKKVALANKALQAKICADKEAVKAELARIEAAKLVIPAEVQTKVDEVIVPEVVVTPVVDPEVVVDPVEEPAAEVVPVVNPEVVVTPVVDPVVDATPVIVPVVEPLVEKTYFEKLLAKFDTKLVDLTAKNTELTSFSAKIISLLEALNLIK